LQRTIPAVSLNQAHKTFGSHTALEALDLTVEQGSITAVLGPNGAGKSTSINLMLGLLRPDSGTVRVMGEDPARVSARRMLGAMLQTAGAPDTLRVRELVRLWSSYYDAPFAFRDVIAMAGLADVVDRRFGELSGGQRRRAAFAFAICGNPRVLFLDEPSAGMDTEARRDFWAQLRALAHDGRTIILTTHYLEEADALADRIVVLNRGRIIADGTPAQIKQHVRQRIIRCHTRIPAEEIQTWQGVVSASLHGTLTTITANPAEPVVRALLTRDSHLSDLSVADTALEDAFVMLVSK
jgi:ABC-2 type transport system ATP-binding protein